LAKVEIAARKWTNVFLMLYRNRPANIGRPRRFGKLHAAPNTHYIYQLDDNIKM
jgi:hypothetical protein